MKLSVIIVSYNVEPYLLQSLSAAERALQGLDAEVFVVDNASSDGSVEAVRKRYPQVKLLANIQNKGFSHANNQAIALARGEYVLLLNPDTIVAENTFSRCIAFMDAHPGVSSVGVKMLNRNGTFAMESRRGLLTPWVAFCKVSKLYKLFPKWRLFGQYYMSYLNEDEANPIDMVSGAYMFIRREVLLQVGVLDETFFMYWEDTDLSYRFLKSGWQNYYLPLPIFHYKGESSVKSTLRYRYYLYSSTLIFLKKHFPLNYRLLYLPIRCAIWFCKFRIHTGYRLLYGKDWENRENESTDCYIVLGSRRVIEEVKEICKRNHLKKEHFFAEANEQNAPDGHLYMKVPPADYTHVLFDTDSYSYNRILSILQRVPAHSLKLATYSIKTGTLITEKNVFYLSK